MELKNCPFCGGQAERIPLIDTPRVRCIEHRHGWERLEDWNNRPIEDALRTRLEAAEAYIQAMEEFDAISCQTEYFCSKSEYDKSVNKCVEKCTSAREAWEKAKENGKS